jgi:hypothetical protein
MTVNNPGPVVYIAPGAEQRIRHWVDLAQGEVSGLGTVIPIANGLLVREVFLLEQVSSSAHTQLDDEAVAKLLMELDAAGEDTSTLRFWWHSHGTMSSFWSTTDDDNIEGLANDAFTVSLVTNKHGQDRVRLDLFQPVRLTLDHLELRLHADDLGLAELCAEEFADKVDERTFVFPRGPGQGCQAKGWSPSSHRLLDPPWPSEQMDDEVIDLDDDWSTRDWELRDYDQLDLQCDDPWHSTMKLEVRR